MACSASLTAPGSAIPSRPDTAGTDVGESALTDLCVALTLSGFILAKDVYQHTRDIDWSQYDGIILLHHGVFTFADDARQSYERMIEIVARAEDCIKYKGATLEPDSTIEVLSSEGETGRLC